jgi:glyceraldehyde-3-phosphate dehydrogenase/erythrose-4-phosphate dehydrogenase
MVTKVGINGFGRIGRLVSQDTFCRCGIRIRTTDMNFRSFATRTVFPVNYLATPTVLLTNYHDSVEHGQVNVVAVNDPFIDPKYAVST